MMMMFGRFSMISPNSMRPRSPPESLSTVFCISSRLNSMRPSVARIAWSSSRGLPRARIQSNTVTGSSNAAAWSCGMYATSAFSAHLTVP